jgi:Trypsin-co-occurring domain 1
VEILTMTEVKRIELKDGRAIFVEMVHADIPAASGASDWKPSDLPDGSQAVGFKDGFNDSFEALRSNIGILAETVHESLKAHQPEEWSLELNIGFKGTTSPIPVILSGEASGGIKVTVKWKRPGVGA